MDKTYLLTQNYPSDNVIWVKKDSYIDVAVLNDTNASTEAAATSHIVPLITQPSQRTLTERNKFAAQLDSFATFYWANTDMFRNFGAFIINEKKGSLKLYNGPSFKNTYSQPQFQDGYTNLAGITFNTQTISFTVGIYWISIEDYRILMNLLHPYEVNMLSFSFEKTYGYFCKLQSIKDSTRYVIGKETLPSTNHSNSTHLQYSQLNTGNTTGPRYYTELNLTFEVIGAQCAKQIEPIYLSPLVFDEDEMSGPPILDYNATWTWDTEEMSWVKLDFGNSVAQNFISDLDYPFDLLLSNVFIKDPLQPATLTLQAALRFGNEVLNTQELFKIGLKNVDQNTAISLKYNSEHGIIYWTLQNQTKILNLLSTQLNGQRIIEYINVSNFFWPGQLNFSHIKDCNVTLVLTCDNVSIYHEPISNDENEDEDAVAYPDIIYTAQRRTNII